jgi:hypothetical protein
MGNFLAEAGFFIGEFSPLGNRKQSCATHTKDFCEKNAAAKLPDFEEFFSEITTFRQ